MTPGHREAQKVHSNTRSYLRISLSCLRLVSVETRPIVEPALMHRPMGLSLHLNINQRAVSAKVVGQIQSKTPGFSCPQGGAWFTCCNDAAVFPLWATRGLCRVRVDPRIPNLSVLVPRTGSSFRVLVPMRQKVVPRAIKVAIAGFIRPPLQLGLVKPGREFPARGTRGCKCRGTSGQAVVGSGGAAYT